MKILNRYCHFQRLILTLLGMFVLSACSFQFKLLDFSSQTKPGPSLQITGPVITSGTSATSFVYTVTYTDVTSISLGNGDINLGGTDSSGCNAAVTGAGTSTRTVTVTNCSGDGTLNFTIDADTGEDAEGNKVPASSVSSNAYIRNSFIIEVDTTALTAGSTANTDVEIKLRNWTTYNFTVDWGDGSLPEAFNLLTTTAGSGGMGQGRTATHTYAVPGIKVIKLRGADLKALEFCTNNDKEKLLDVQQWGPIVWDSMESMFAGCRVMQISAPDAPILTNVTHMTSMFYGATAFNSPIEHWDTSTITHMTNLFADAESFNQPLAGWDVSNVRYMNSMFSNALAFNQPLAAWDVSSVEEMQFIFAWADAFNQPIGNWDVSNVQNMNSMFADTAVFNQPLAEWDTSSATSMEGMFRASVFNQPISAVNGKWNTSNVLSMNEMFAQATNFNQDISSWDTSSVANFSSMFQNATAFNSPLALWNTSAATNMASMFAGAASFNRPIPRSGASWNTTGVTNMTRMFQGAASFNQNIGNWITSGVTAMDYMFQSAGAFDQDLSTWDVTGAPTHIDFDQGTNWTLPKPNFPP